VSARLALAFVAGCTSASLLYCTLRLLQAVVMPEPDPALVMWSEHSGFFWRSWTSAYAGGMIALVTWLFAGRAPERTARFVARTVFPIAAALALQAALVP
jgi:hypothetical protein